MNATWLANNLTSQTNIWSNHSDETFTQPPWSNATIPVYPSHPPARRPVDCSHGIMLARYITEVVISFPVAVLGIIGNVLAFIVLCRQRQRLTTTVLLQGLAIADTLVLISIVLGRCFRYLAMCNSWSAYTEIFPELFRWLYPLTYFFRQTDVWLITLLTIDRWIAVCKPLHAQRLCTLSRAYKQMTAVTIGSMVVTLPRFFELSLSDSGQIATHWLLRIKSYTIAYRIILFFLFMYLIPMALLMILNTRLLKTLRKADIYRAALRESRNQTTSCVSGFRSITWMVVTVVIVCVLCNILAIVSHILYSLAECFRYLKYLEKPRRYMAMASNIMITINSAMNFVIYCMCSKNFRNNFIQTFCSCPAPGQPIPASKRSSGGGISAGSGTGLMYFSLPQSRRKTNSLASYNKDSHDVPPTPPPMQQYKITNGVYKKGPPNLLENMKEESKM